MLKRDVIKKYMLKKHQGIQALFHIFLMKIHENLIKTKYLTIWTLEPK